MKPSCGAVLPLDERRPRYVGERVILWGKNSCAAFRGTADEIKARAASATTCPDYRPLGSCEFAAAYVINRNMYEFEELGAVGDAGYGTYGDNCINSDNLERADAVLKGRSVLAVVTAVHPTDAFVVQSTGWRHPRKFFTQARSGETGAHDRLGTAKLTQDELWTTGSVDLVLFDARFGTFTGPALESVPLFLVNGGGRNASLLEAKLISQAELFRLLGTEENALLCPILARLALATDTEQLVSELCSWASSITMEASDDVIEQLLVLQEAVVGEQRLQAFVESCFVRQYQGAELAWLTGQKHFPDKLPEPGVTYRRVLQDYDPEPLFRPERERDRSGVMRTDYLLW